MTVLETAKGGMRANRNRLLVRVLKLMALLEREPVRPDVEALARELGVSSHTVRRDLAALSEAHWPVPPSAWQLEHQR